MQFQNLVNIVVDHFLPPLLGHVARGGGMFENPGHGLRQDGRFVTLNNHTATVGQQIPGPARIGADTGAFHAEGFHDASWQPFAF